MTDDFEYRRHWRRMSAWQAIMASLRCAIGTHLLMWTGKLMWPHVSSRTQTAFWQLSGCLRDDTEQVGRIRGFQ